LFVEESHALPLVHFQVVIPDGSLADPVGQEGLTRLCARLLRRGTRTRETQAIEEAIDALGAELSIETSPAFVRIGGSVIRRSLEPLMALVGELLHEPSFPESELGQLKRESLAALLEMTDNDQGLCATHFRRALFRGHPYGRTSLGSKQTLQAISHEQVVARFRDGIARQERQFAFSGNITRSEAETLVQKYLVSPLAIVTARARPPEPVQQKGRHLLIIDKPERTQTQIQIGSLGTHPHDADHTALLVGNAIFGGTFTARLMRAVRSERGWSYGASSRLAIDRVREGFSVWTFPAAEDATPCIELELTLLEEWIDGGIKQEELDFVKSYLVKSHAFSIDTAEKRVEQAVDVSLYDLPPDYFSAYTSRIENTTLAEVNAALQNRLSAKDLVISVLATDADVGDKLRSLPELASVAVVPFDVDAG